jgi:hypothetical protein
LSQKEIAECQAGCHNHCVILTLAAEQGNTMESKTQSDAGQAREAAPAYRTFSHTATHGASDTRCYHGKPEDWRRNHVKRTVGGKAK